MPLVTENIKTEFTGDASDLIAESKKVIKELEEKKRIQKELKRELEEQARAEEEAAKKSTFSWTEFRSAYQTVLDVVQVGKQIWEETAQKYIDNAIEVGNLARNLGTTTEEASRLQQISDDLGISMDTLKTSFRAAQKDGFAPTVEGLAQMSDEYLKLAPGVERAQFLMDRFGKSGQDMAILLEQGSDSIRSNAAAVEESLIVTEKAYEQARKYEIATDNLSDAWDSFTYKTAPPLVDAMTGLVNAQLDGMRAQELLNEQGLRGIQVYDKRYQAALEQAQAEREAAEAAILNADAANEASGAFESEAEKATRLKEELQATEEAIRNTTKANQDYLNLVGTLTGSIDSYKQKQAEVQQQLNDGKITLDEAKEKWQELADQQEAASRRMILNMLEQQLMVGGLSEAEATYLLDTGLKWGVYSQEAVEAAKAAQKEVATLTAQLNNVPQTITSSIYVTTYTSRQDLINSTGVDTRDSGGEGTAGTPYMIGTGAQPELFVPKTDGQFIPNADGLGLGGNSQKIEALLQQIANQRPMSESKLGIVFRDAISQAFA